MMISVGILAGMGPGSTAPFIDMLVNDCRSEYGATYDMDFPKMHIISLPTPFWPGKKIDDTAMITALQQGIEELVRAQVSFISIPCNLAHCYFAEIKQASAGIPVLHIADSAIESLPDGANRVAILATEPVAEAGIYQDRITASGKSVIDSREQRDMVTSLISLVKSAGFYAPEVREAWLNLMSKLGKDGADAVLIACTDLSPLATENPLNFIITDTAGSLSRTTIKQYRKLITAE